MSHRARYCQECGEPLPDVGICLCRLGEHLLPKDTPVCPFCRKVLQTQEEVFRRICTKCLEESCESRGMPIISKAEFDFAQQERIKHKKQVEQLKKVLQSVVEAARPFLVDDLTCIETDAWKHADVRDPEVVLKEYWQCNHCGAHDEDPMKIEHHDGCIAERLRKALFAAAERITP